MGRHPSLSRAAKRLNVGQKALMSAIRDIPGPGRKLTLQRVQEWEADPPLWIREEWGRRDQTAQRKASKRSRDQAKEAQRMETVEGEVAEMIRANDPRLNSGNWLDKHPDHQLIYADYLVRDLKAQNQTPRYLED